MTMMGRRHELEAVLDGSFDAGFLMAESGSILHFNQTGSDMFRLEEAPRSAAINIESCLEFSGSITASGFRWKDVMHQLLTQNMILPEYEATGLRGDTNSFPVRVKMTLLHGEQQESTYVLFFVRRVQEEFIVRKPCQRSGLAYQGNQGETSSTIGGSTKSMQQVESLMMAIVEASLDPMFQINESGIIQMVNNAAVRKFGWRRSELVGSNISMICGGAHGKNHNDYIQRYLKTGETKVIGKSRELPARRKDGSEFPIELAVAEVETFTGEERLFCGYVHDLTELKRRQNLLAGTIEASLDPMFQINEKGIIYMANRAAAVSFGWKREEFEGRNISMICGGGHSQNHDKYIQRFLETGITKVIGKKRELPARRKDGSEFPIELGVAEVETEQGQERLFCGYVHDLTIRKRKESLLAGTIEASLDPMFQINERGLIQMVNKAAVQLFGWSYDELIGKNISMITGGNHAANHDEYMRRYLETGETRVIGKKRELPARKKDGSEFPIELGVVEIRTDSREERLFCGFVRDLSGVKGKERISVGIIESSLDPMFQINELGIIQLVNEAAVKQFGWSREEFMGRNISKICGGGHAHNHDKYIQRFLETGVSKVIGKKRELPARRKDGSEFPIELGVVEVETHHGQERLFCGLVRDLTRQKEHENELKRSEAFTNRIIESSCDAVFVTDSQGLIHRVNAAASNMFGWSREEFLKKNITDMFAPPVAADFKEETRQLITVGKTVRRELDAIKKDESTIPVLMGVAAVEGPSGSVFLAIFISDLTDKKAMMKIEIEKTAAELLLMNVLPESIADRLRDDPSPIAEHHKCATILFADIVGFTAMSSNMKPGSVVFMLNEVFTLFDELVEKYDLNKVKTIGDCYMVTSVPVVEHEEHECSRVCHFAIDLLEALETYNRSNTDHDLSIRVGINAGPVVAGVVGTKRFLYDLWGDAVNLASRMESNGIPGRIQVTQEVVDLVGDSFYFESRGIIHVKGKGEMETFLIKKRKRQARSSIRRPRNNSDGAATLAAWLQDSMRDLDLK